MPDNIPPTVPPAVPPGAVTPDPRGEELGKALGKALGAVLSGILVAADAGWEHGYRYEHALTCLNSASRPVVPEPFGSNPALVAHYQAGFAMGRVDYRAERGWPVPVPVLDPGQWRELPPVPASFPVRVLGVDDPGRRRLRCRTCGRAWDDAVPTSETPAPAGRCPFEHFH